METLEIVAVILTACCGAIFMGLTIFWRKMAEDLTVEVMRLKEEIRKLKNRERL